MKEDRPVVYIVDDDVSVRRSLAKLLRSAGLGVEVFDRAEEFLKQEEFPSPGCLILDINLPGLDGLGLQKELLSNSCPLPIVFITGYGTVPMTVRAMKGGAVEFLEKPVDQHVLLNSVHQAIEKDRQARQRSLETKEIQYRLDSLTAREREVLPLVVSGLLNKQIAFELGVTEKTIKVHRARIMQKMQAGSFAELVFLAQKAGIEFKRRDGLKKI
jgi:FixJ family two-component response regulator